VYLARTGRAGHCSSKLDLKITVMSHTRLLYDWSDGPNCDLCYGEVKCANQRDEKVSKDFQNMEDSSLTS
jgi:hypothetical protein